MLIIFQGASGGAIPSVSLHWTTMVENRVGKDTSQSAHR